MTLNSSGAVMGIMATDRPDHTNKDQLPSVCIDGRSGIYRENLPFCPTLGHENPRKSLSTALHLCPVSHAKISGQRKMENGQGRRSVAAIFDLPFYQLTFPRHSTPFHAIPPLFHPYSTLVWLLQIADAAIVIGFSTAYPTKF